MMHTCQKCFCNTKWEFHTLAGYFVIYWNLSSTSSLRMERRSVAPRRLVLSDVRLFCSTLVVLKIVSKNGARMDGATLNVLGVLMRAALARILDLSTKTPVTFEYGRPEQSKDFSLQELRM
eukprot:1615565-Amphidinium_carterae.1